MNINVSPIFIGMYPSGERNYRSITDDLTEHGIELLDEEIEKLVDAISSDVIAKLPDGFQGAREQNNPDVFRLFTTRHHKKV